MTTMPIRGFDPSPAVEVAPDPVPYMPGIAGEEGLEPVAPLMLKSEETVQPQMSVIELLQQMVPQADAPAVEAPPVVEAPPAVEVAPEPIPYMPQIVEPEAPPPAPPPQPKLPQPVPQTLPDLSLMDFIQPVPMAELAPELAPEVVPQMSPAEQQEMDRFLLEYLMSQDMAVME